MKVVGLNFSDASIEAVELRTAWFGKPVVSAIHRVMIEPGIIENGIIMQIDALSQALGTLLAEAQPKAITAQIVRLSIPESQVFSRVLGFPRTLTPEQITASLQHQISRYLPFQLDEVVYDHMMLGVHNGQHEVMVAAVQRTVVEAYEMLCAKHQLAVQAYELESVSTARVVLPQDQELYLLLDIGARTTIASFFEAGQLRLSYNIPMAGHRFTAALVDAYRLTESEAEKLKQRVGFTAQSGKQDVRSVLEQVCEPISGKVSEGISYVEEKTGKTLKAVYLVGGSAQLPDSDRYFNEQLQVPVSRSRILLAMKKNDILDKLLREQLYYSNACGLALGVLQDKRSYLDFNVE